MRTDGQPGEEDDEGEQDADDGPNERVPVAEAGLDVILDGRRHRRAQDRDL